MSSLYCLKAIGAFFVVCIHFYSPLLLYPLIRTAVPFFFVISGYFLYHGDPAKSIERCKRAFKKMLWITLYANIFYFLVNKAIPFQNLRSLFSFMLLRPWFCFHLWYLSAYIEVLLVVIIAHRFGKLRLLWYLSPLFILLGLLLGGYGFLFSSLPQNLLFSRNFITIGIPCFGMGWLLRQYKDKVIQVVTQPCLLVVLLFTLSAIEVFVLYANVSSRGDYLIFTMPLSVSLVVYCLKHPSLGSGSVWEYIGRHFSIDIFIYHVFIGSMFAKVQRYIYFPQPAMPFLIFVATVMFTLVWQNALKRYLQH